MVPEGAMVSLKNKTYKISRFKKNFHGLAGHPRG